MPSPRSPARQLVSHTAALELKFNPVGTLEAERRACLGRRRNLETEFLDNPADLRHLLRIALGQLAGPDIERILKPDANVTAHHGGIGTEVHLMPSAGEDRPVILIAEQPIGRALHEQQVVEIGTNAAENAEDKLHEHRRPEHAAIDAMREVVEMAGVVALVLEFDAVAFAEKLGDLLDVAKRIGEDVSVGIGEIALLPIVFPVLEAPRHRIEREVHRSHVERAHFRRQKLRGGDALLHRHGHRAAGSDVDDRVGRLLDARQKLHEYVWIRRRPAVLRVARVQVQDGGSRLGGIDRLRRNLIGRERQCIRHGRGVDRPGDRATDDDLVGHL